MDLHIHSSTSCLSHTCTKTIAEIGFSVTCSVSGAPTNTDVLEWLFAGSTLPDDIMTTFQIETSGNINTYTSTLLFPPLQLYHTGVYTCKVGGNERLAGTINIRVNGTSRTSVLLLRSVINYISFFLYTLDISTNITERGLTLLGQDGYRIWCTVGDSLHASMTYQWTRNNGTQIQSVIKALSFAPLRLSDAGNHSCKDLRTVSSSRLSRSITAVIVYVKSESKLKDAIIIN